MAWALTPDEEKKAQEQSTAPGGGSGPAPVAAGASPAAAKAPSASGRFAPITNYLDKNKAQTNQFGQKVADRNNVTADAAEGQIGSEGDAFRKQVDAGIPKYDAAKVNAVVANPTQYTYSGNIGGANAQQQGTANKALSAGTGLAKFGQTAPKATPAAIFSFDFGGGEVPTTPKVTTPVTKTGPTAEQLQTGKDVQRMASGAYTGPKEYVPGQTAQDRINASAKVTQDSWRAPGDSQGVKSLDSFLLGATGQQNNINTSTERNQAVAGKFDDLKTSLGGEVTAAAGTAQDVKNKTLASYKPTTNFGDNSAELEDLRKRVGAGEGLTDQELTAMGISRDDWNSLVKQRVNDYATGGKAADSRNADPLDLLAGLSTRATAKGPTSEQYAREEALANLFGQKNPLAATQAPADDGINYDWSKITDQFSTRKTEAAKQWWKDNTGTDLPAKLKRFNFDHRPSEEEFKALIPGDKPQNFSEVYAKMSDQDIASALRLAKEKVSNPEQQDGRNINELENIVLSPPVAMLARWLRGEDAEAVDKTLAEGSDPLDISGVSKNRKKK